MWLVRWSNLSVFKLLTSYFTSGWCLRHLISVVSGDLIYGRRQDNVIDSRPPASKYQMRRRAEGFGRSHGGGRMQGTIRIGAVLQQHERPWWSMIRLRERDEVDGAGSCISAKHASSSLSLKILLSCVDGDCGLVNSGRGGSGDSPSTGERSGHRGQWRRLA